MLCVGVFAYGKELNANLLGDNTTYLLLFDGTMKNFLQVEYPCRYNLIKSFEKYRCICLSNSMEQICAVVLCSHADSDFQLFTTHIENYDWQKIF